MNSPTRYSPEVRDRAVRLVLCLCERFSALNEGRSLNPGDTRTAAKTKMSTAAALNEGRSLNPGDTL